MQQADIPEASPARERAGWIRFAAALPMWTVAGGLVGLALYLPWGGDWLRILDGWLLQVLAFSVSQALLSAGLSLLLAVPCALSLAAQPFRGASLVATLLNLAFIMPVLAVALGVALLFGPGGWLEREGGAYGWTGILVAHVLLNLPFAVRVFWWRLAQIPPHHARLAQLMGLTPWACWRWIRLPPLWAAARSLFVLITLLCFSSFTVILVLGGGPKFTNLEVAIYQALRLDFDLQAAGIMALIHAALASGLILVAGRMQTLAGEQAPPVTLHAKWPRAHQWLTLGLLTLALLMPHAALLERALRADWVIPARLSEALMTSLSIAVTSALLAVSVAVARALRRAEGGRLADYGLLGLPVMVLATGWYLLALKTGWVRQAGWPLVVLFNALMALPLIFQPLRNRLEAVYQRDQRTVQLLGLTRWATIRWIYGPQLWPVLRWALGMAAVLSLGDLGIAALVGSTDFVTLPLLIYQAMGSYRMATAAQIMLILLTLCAVTLWLAERRGMHAAR
ncbi:MAG: ABC transporter permease subunit [Gammaproteobacteria bacterium]|nr:MAG: ABC transporter permease subunit [Gammaproteobacteria bacterium]